MQYYTQEELESVTTLSKQEIQDCFMQLTRLIIHCKDNEARDYCNQLSIVVSNSLSNKPTVTKVIVPTPEPDLAKPSAFFAWSAHQETCYFCKKIIPARTAGHGVFMNQDYSRKWCESCATDEHKKHPNYLKYKK